MLNLWRRKYKKDPKKSLLENLSAEFSFVFGHALNWQWDARFDAVVLQIKDQQKEAVIQILENYFSDYWNVLNPEEVPKEIEKLIKSLDGMTPEQLLFSTSSDSGELVYCAWWPWKDGQNTSIRLASFLDGLSTADEKAAHIQQIKQWFAISD